ncbi:MAG: acyl-CoA dehydrogenase family protein, partial [Alphaproteobacteria bacterium]|nr:acyl-CoA dehydrogenase family protein [Alphaproteobacteria bacterium]
MTDERRLIKDSARAFTMKEVLPVANELDPVQGKIPMDLRNKMGEMGYFGITIPTRYGGMGLGCFEYCLVAEELARGWMSVASLIARGNGLIGSRGMTEEQLQDRLPKVARGEWLGAFSMSEPGAGSDISALTCRAVQEGDEWVITGNKYWCTFADDADYIYVVARTEPIDPKARHKGISGFIVEKPRGELPNNCKGAVIPKIGYFGWNTFELAFDGCRVPLHAQVGGKKSAGNAFYQISSGLERARAHTAARSIGLAQGA